MADADGNAGGTFATILTVSGTCPHARHVIYWLKSSPAGQDSSCLPSRPSSSLAIVANVTKDLSTCQPLGLKVSGGAPPYIISLVAVGSTIVTNMTLPSSADVMTYINRASPNSQVLGEYFLYD